MYYITLFGGIIIVVNDSPESLIVKAKTLYTTRSPFIKVKGKLTNFYFYGK